MAGSGAGSMGFRVSFVSKMSWSLASDACCYCINFPLEDALRILGIKPSHCILCQETPAQSKNSLFSFEVIDVSLAA